MKLSDKIRALRKKNKLSQTKLSELINVERKQIYRYEIDDAKPSIDTLKKIADTFNVTTDFLLSDDADIELGNKNDFADKELYMYFQEISKMDNKTKDAVKLIIKKIILSEK